MARRLASDIARLLSVLSGAVPEDPTNKATNLWFNTVYSAAMRVLRVSYNRLGGIALPPGFLVEGRMEEIYCDHNEFLVGPHSGAHVQREVVWLDSELTLPPCLSVSALLKQNVWPEIFTASIPLAIVDFSHNLLAAPTAATDFAAGAPAPQFRKLDFTGNPNFRLATLPSWITIDVTRVQQPGDLFSCSTFSANTAPNMIFKVDAIFFEYKHCGCVPGTFGSAPVCQYVPTGVVLNPYAQISSPELASVSSVITAEGGIASQLTLPNVTAYPVSAETAKATPAGAELYVPAFSDGMYGADSRLTLGMATSWVVDLQDLYADNIDEYTARELTVPVPIETYRLNISALDASIDKSLLTPVRVIVLRLHVSATAFDAFSDQIMIYEGDSSLKGNRVYSLRGTDGLPAVSASEYTSTSAYIHLHNASLSQIDSPALIEIPVYSPIATVAFNSRDISGNHFYATYSYAFECPDGYFYNLDLSPPQCRVNRTSFVIDSGIRSAVFAVGALAMAVVLANIIVMAVRWESPVFKAASRPFMLLMLVLLFCMALGSLLYAAIPDPSLKSSAAICIGRAWLTCLPLAGFLAILLAKTSRLDAIFGATTLQVRKHSDADLLKTVAAVAALQIVLLAVFSGMPLSKAAILVGKGSQSDQLVTQCTQESGFMSWLGAEIAFIVCLILPAAYFGFRTRDLPSQYNESGHIQNCLIFMAFFLCVVVPLDNFIKDNPEATVLIQGLGQAFLCILMTLIMFGPKCYYLSNLSSRARGVGNVGGPTQIPTAIDAEKSGSGTMASSGYASTKPASNNVARKTSTLGPTGGSTGQRTSTLGSGQSSTVRPLPVTMNPNLKRDSSVTPTNGTGSATQSPLADGRKSISGATGARTIPAATSVSPRLGAAVPTVLPTAVPAVALTDPGVASPSNIHVLVSSPPNSPRRQIKVHGLSASSHTIGSPSAQQ
jgi:hypothetical protein